MKIVVLAGGLSPERNVSLSTGTMVTEALRGLGHRAALVDLFFGLEGHTGALEDLFDAPLSAEAKHISTAAPDLEQVRASRKDQSASVFGPGVVELCQAADLVFLALHGACGEDGRVQAAFDLMGIPYTGAGYLSSAIAMDKDLTKRMVEEVVSTPGWKTVHYTAEDIDGLVAKARLPLVVKPVASGSSIGVSIAHTAQELRAALTEGLSLGGRTVLEQYVKGREVQVGILDGTALPSIEIIPKADFYDYANKYQPGAALEVCPAPVTEQEEKKLREAAVRVYELLGLSVYARADFILDEAGEPWFLEINTLPGMTPTSLLPQEAAAVGIDYPTLCQRIVNASLEARKQGK
ncbi:D-alanine--D-alanine ligase [Pseudoflavonifractor phocaeensis]|uniref:D-alanine--D-alanine ligase family protein n=1 Tax=Pseudoflavonifractor phocaeensis TaxID=1870988 RepID=UPI00195B7728|nr:D-alanine--D-alanine ligase [Pseudoflavonifractor phocaeensis]MBM6869259.1 D-alanine--D-alanine ligase [Pseudoflavonifractor phocaeensis]MBM6937007.1 D-alanine--D-alanine ligase [Pseudoflavonifractor phocaeensis]